MSSLPARSLRAALALIALSACSTSLGGGDGGSAPLDAPLDAASIDPRCASAPDGSACDASLLVTCSSGRVVAMLPCPDGCASGACNEPPAPGFCASRVDGSFCDASDLVTCTSGLETGRVPCTNGCVDPGAGMPGLCASTPPSGTFCVGLQNGLWCDGDDLVRCLDDVAIARSTCPNGCLVRPPGTPDECAPMTGGFCVGRLNGDWCDGDDLVTCRDGTVSVRTTCAMGCVSMPVGVPDVCRSGASTFCASVPSTAEASPPASRCNSMDWELSSDGWYLISRFGTDADSTTLGRRTTCSWLQAHYDYRDCVYDSHTARCVASDPEIPWVQGHVDYARDAMLALVDAHAPSDVPMPEYFYVAGAQRFGCGATLRVSNPANGHCVVAYAEDGGPGARYEYADRGGRRILDSSPAVVRFLGVTRWGWASSDLVMVEWGRPGDVPGHACTPCESARAQRGTESMRPVWDPDHMLPTTCR